MTLRAATATVTLCLASVFASAQQKVPQFTDPANLRGERVKPRDGRELPIDQGARGLEQMLRRLNTRASLMLIVAHPDDEDGGMLTYYSRGLGARVAVLTLTRGEGGQNAMTGDFEDALGLLRTQELLSADRYLGVDQFFGTEVDFGFSKTKEEAFRKWTHERVLYDAVRSIRLYRPLVIAAVFIGGVTDGHGQHQVSGQIAQEAFKAAADPTVFPDMIAEGILPWQALKVYARVPMQSISDKGLFDYATGKYTAPRFENYVTGEVTTTVPSSDVIVHEGTVDPILSDNPSDPPRTYVQFARIGLGMQKSQIGGGVRVPPAGAFDVAYHLYGSALTTKGSHPERSEGPATPSAAAPPLEPSSHEPQSASFFDGIDTSIGGIGTLTPSPFAPLTEVLANVSTKIKAATESFDPNRPSVTAPKLAEAAQAVYGALSIIAEFKLGSSYSKENVIHELQVKSVQLNDALALALGLTLTAKTPSDTAITGTTVDASVSLSQDSQLPIIYKAVMSGNSSGEGIQEGTGLPGSEPRLAPGHPLLTQCGLSPNLTATATRPYFFRSSIEKPVYELAAPNLRNAPATPPALTCFVQLSYDDVPLTIGAIAEHDSQPVQKVPIASLSLSSSALVLPSDEGHLDVGVTFEYWPTAAHLQDFFKILDSAMPVIAVPDGWISTFRGNDKPSQLFYRIQAPSTRPNIVTAKASSVLPTHETITEGYRPIGYGDLPRTNYFTPATVRIVPVDLNLPTTRRIAYLPGTGDAVPGALASINLKPEILTVADLTPAKLAHYDTVILGVRTYAAHPDLHGAPTQALLDYARNGGNVLAQYQTAEFTAADAPYPLTLGYSAEKVVDETAAVQLLGLCDQPGSKPPHPCEQSSMNNAGFLPGSLRDYDLLTTPNKITPADFNDWVEERGHGFLSSWDSHYTSLTETHDPDQDPQRGGLITTPLGKGRWTYCAFALYRQLPEAVPGAFRLFVNLLNNPLSP